MLRYRQRRAREDMTMSGVILTLGYKITCGRCGTADAFMAQDSRDGNPIPPMSYLEREFRERGWGKSRRDGWVCPACKGKRGAQV